MFLTSGFALADNPGEVVASSPETSEESSEDQTVETTESESEVVESSDGDEALLNRQNVVVKGS